MTDPLKHLEKKKHEESQWKLTEITFDTKINAPDIDDIFWEI